MYAGEMLNLLFRNERVRCSSHLNSTTSLIDLKRRERAYENDLYYAEDFRRRNIFLEL